MIGDRLKQLRTEKRIRQSDVAESIEVGRTTYTNYETGVSEPDLDTINRLARFFNVSSDYLLGRTNDRSPSTSNEDWPDDVKVMMRDAAKLTEEQKDIVKRLINQFVNEK